MKNIFALICLIALFIIGCSDGSTLTSALDDEAPAVSLAANGGQNKTEVCHLDEDSNAFKLITIADPAFDAHLAHGDGVPGGAVPGQSGFVFDENCIPQSPYTFVDFNEASQGVGGGGTNNAANVATTVVVNGYNVINSILLVDTSVVPGYEWEVNIVDFDSPGLRCVYSVVALRARAELNGSVERIDFDGYDSNPFGFLSSPWDLANGDRPTLVVESVTFDQNSRTCS